MFVGDVGRPDLLESAAGKKGAMEPAARQLQESLYNRLTPLRTSCKFSLATARGVPGVRRSARFPPLHLVMNGASMALSSSL